MARAGGQGLLRVAQVNCGEEGLHISEYKLPLSDKILSVNRNFMRRLFKKMGALAGVLFALTLLGLGLFYFNQEKLIFFPEHLDHDFHFAFPTRFQEANIDIGSDTSINYLVFNPDSTKGVILYFHGNAGSLKDWGWAGAEIAQRTDWAVWMMDFPGYGKSTGTLPKNEKILLSMARALRDEISKKHASLPLVLYGRSIGSAIASALAAEKPATALILETPYRSLAKLGHEIYPFLPESFSRFDLDNERGLRSVGSMPVLIVHGTSDSVIPFRHGKFLSGIAPHTRFIAVEGGDHNNLSQFPEYWPALKTFLSQ